jgi:hypothetical protein
MKGFKPSRNRGVSGARKRQKAAGDHSVSKVKQKRGGEAQKTSMAYGKLQADRPVRDNIIPPMKGD